MILSKLGHWSTVGDGASIGWHSQLGPWSNIGPRSKVGHFVTFGMWACVGMDAVVESGAVLGSHEYVPSGYRRTRFGRTVKRWRWIGVTNELHELYDQWATSIPAGAYTHEEYQWRKEIKARRASRLSELGVDVGRQPPFPRPLKV